MTELHEQAKKRLIEELEEIIESDGCKMTMDKAFEIWSAENLAGLNTQDAIDAAKVGGKGDCGCDFYNYDDSERVLSFGQAKWSDNFNYSVTDDDIKKYFLGTFDKLENCPDDANIEFKNHSDEFNDIKNVSKIRTYLVVTGKLNERAEKLLNEGDFRKIHQGDNDWIVYTLDDILGSVIVDKTSPLKIGYEIKPVIKTDQNSQKKSLLGYISGKKLVSICTNKTYKNNIFQENPRKTLMKTSVNKGILKSLDRDDERQIFYKLNNGITACCNKITEISDTEFEIDNFKIVNGRQSTFALAQKPLLLNDVTVELKIHEIKDDKEMRLISRCTNNQNPIKLSDLAHDADALRILDIKFKSYNEDSTTKGAWKFELQRGDYNELSKSEKRLYTRKRKLEKEPMARTFLGYAQKPSFGISYTEKEIFDTSSQIFKDIFDKKDTVNFIIPHIFFEILRQVDKNWKNDASKTKDQNLLRQKVVKLYLLSFINDSLEKHPNKVDITKKIIQKYECLESTDLIPEELIQIGEVAYKSFKKCWKDHAKQNQIDPNDFTNTRKYLIRTDTAIDALLELKLDLEDYTSKDIIAEKLSHFK